MNRIVLKLLMFWLPVPVTLVTAWLWLRYTGSGVMAGYATLLPLVYGYLMPFIAINLLKRWRFRHGIMIGGMYLHHGFMYASKLSLFGLLPLLLLGPGYHGWGACAAWVASTSLLYMLTARLQDLLSLRYGYVQFPEVPDAGTAQPKPALAYAPLCFSLIGICYSAGLVATYNICTAGEASPARVLAVAAVSFGALMTLPSLAYRALSAPGTVRLQGGTAADD